MDRRLIIDGNAVFEIDEDCMLKKRLDHGEKEPERRMDSHKNKRTEHK